MDIVLMVTERVNRPIRIGPLAERVGRFISIVILAKERVRRSIAIGPLAKVSLKRSIVPLANERENGSIAIIPLANERENRSMVIPAELTTFVSTDIFLAVSWAHHSCTVGRMVS